MPALKLATSVLVLATAATAAAARDQVRVVGSSTVFPYTQAAAENFSNATGMAAPVVESTGTGGGMKIFCEGVGEGFADITGASRAMKKSEYELCARNGVTDITEVLIGYDGLSIAVSRATTFTWALTEAQIFQALAAEVPVNGAWVANPNMKWSDIDAALPDTAILAYGPPPTSGTRDAFVELTMHDGCKVLPEYQAIKADKEAAGKMLEEHCSRMRQDGPFVEAGENDNLIVQRLEADPKAVGIFGYSFLYENNDKLMGIAIDGVEPSPETIADFSYGVARPIYFYVKNAHRGVIAGLNEFIAEYVSDGSLGDGGYQQERGLTVLAADKLAEVQAAATGAVAMTVPEK